MGMGRNIKTMEEEIKRRKNISIAHKGKKKSDKWLQSRKNFKPSKQHKDKISKTLKKYYSIQKNKDVLLKNLRDSDKLRNKESLKNK